MRAHDLIRLLSLVCLLGVLVAYSPAVGAQPRATETESWRCWDDRHPDPCHHTLQSVAWLQPDENDGWAVGSHGTLLRWDGIAWTPFTNPAAEETLLSVSMVAADDAWAAGSRQTLLHWDGSVWEIVSLPGGRGMRYGRPSQEAKVGHVVRSWCPRGGRA